MKIIYCNQVDPSEETGQGTHEKEILSLLLNDNEVCGHYVGQKPSKKSFLSSHPFAVTLKLNKSTLGFLLYQWRLFFSLFKLLLKDRSKAVIFLRYAPSMISPLLISLIFSVPLIIRTGPIIRNLAIYKGNVNPLLKFEFILYHFYIILKHVKSLLLLQQSRIILKIIIVLMKRKLSFQPMVVTHEFLIFSNKITSSIN